MYLFRLVYFESLQCGSPIPTDNLSAEIRRRRMKAEVGRDRDLVPSLPTCPERVPIKSGRVEGRQVKGLVPLCDNGTDLAAIHYTHLKKCVTF